MSDPVPNHQEYVVGFMFAPTLQYVALIRKTKPKWQAGKLNGIGGKVEPGETSFDAMVREFQEETGQATQVLQWNHFASMAGPTWQVGFFATIGDLVEVKSTTDELVEIAHVASVAQGGAGVIENLPWLLLLAVDHLQDGRPTFASISYPS